MEIKLISEFNSPTLKGHVAKGAETGAKWGLASGLMGAAVLMNAAKKRGIKINNKKFAKAVPKALLKLGMKGAVYGGAAGAGIYGGKKVIGQA